MKTGKFFKFIMFVCMGLSVEFCLVSSVITGERDAGDFGDETDFEVTVELVELDMTVRDGNDEPVDDLRADEVEVYENGVKQKIALFEHFKRGDFAGKTLDGFELSQDLTPKRSILWIYFFDQYGLNVQHMQEGLKAFRESAVANWRPGDVISLVTYAGELLILADGITDPSIFDDYIASFDLMFNVGQKAFLPENTQTVTQGDPEKTPLAKMNVNGLHGHSHSSVILNCLQRIALATQTVERRKNVILISSGSYMDGRMNHDSSGQLEEWEKIAAHSRLVVYTVDVTGLTAPWGDISQFNLFQFFRRAPLRFFSELSGGTFQKDSNDLGSMMSSASEDLKGMYYIAYYPERPGRSDEKFRRIKVEIPGRKVKIRARKGYYLAAE